MQTYLETEQNLSVLLEQASQDGEVRIKRQNGETFVVKPEAVTRSPLDVKGVDLDVSTAEVIEIVRTGRERH